MSARAKNWCLTWNNYDELTMIDAFQNWPCDYIVFGKEIAPNTGTHHIQGYCVFTERKRLSQLKSLCPTAHWEEMKGTPKQASDYCKKVNDFMERGTLPLSQGTAGRTVIRENYARIHLLAKEGNVHLFLEEHPKESFLHMHRFNDLMKLYRPCPSTLDGPLKNEWYMGSAGTGKSSLARVRHPNYYLKPTATKWWPGYNMEEIVLIDDIGKTMDYVLEHLKIWADRYPFQAENKGEHTGMIRPQKIVITTQHHWDDITADPELRAAIARRFTLIKFGEELGELTKAMVSAELAAAPKNNDKQDFMPCDEESVCVQEEEEDWMEELLKEVS